MVGLLYDLRFDSEIPLRTINARKKTVTKTRSETLKNLYSCKQIE